MVKEKKGHRRVDREGNISFRRQPLEVLGHQIQLGIQTYLQIKENQKQNNRDILLEDFKTTEELRFPEAIIDESTGQPSNTLRKTHDRILQKIGITLDNYSSIDSFDFKAYSSHAFRYFRNNFGIKDTDYSASIGKEWKETGQKLIPLSNPGASGSLFWKTQDDHLIIKTVQKNEYKFLKHLLPGYYLNITQNPRTLLPKFLGMYRIQAGDKNIRVLVMNNLLPSSVPLGLKFDLKGSSHGRNASEKERSKKSPIYKCNDFRKMFSKNGIYLEDDLLSTLLQTIKNDCLVLESFKIMDYSLLLAIYNIDEHKRSQLNSTTNKKTDAIADSNVTNEPLETSVHENETSEIQDTIEDQWITASRSNMFHDKSKTKNKRVQKSFSYFTPITSIMKSESNVKRRLIKEQLNHYTGGIPAYLANGDRVLLYIGIIDILQDYRFIKWSEHFIKSIVYDGSAVSVTDPKVYKKRFVNFMQNDVFLCKIE